MSEWRKVQLQDVVTRLGDGLHGTPEYDNNGDYYFINGNNLQNGAIIFKSDTKRVNFTEYEKYKKDLNDRTILISINGTLGNMAFYNGEKCILGKSTCYFNVSDEADKWFIKYVLMTDIFKDYLVNFANGTTIANVSLKQMKEFEFSLPPLAVQHSIAEVLSSLDDKIDLLTRQNATLEALAQTYFRQWFVEEVHEDWKEGVVGDKYDIYLGGTPSRKRDDYWGDGSIGWINSGKVNEFRILTPSEFITEVGFKNSATKLLPAGTTVIAITGATLGQISILQRSYAANQSVIGLVPKSNYSNEFIFFWLKENMEELISRQTGGAQQHINSDDVRSFGLVFPSDVALKKFETVFTPMTDKITCNCFIIETLQKLRDTLLPKLISGEVKVRA